MLLAFSVTPLVPGAAYVYGTGHPFNGDLIGWALYFGVLFFYPLIIVFGLPLLILLRECPAPRLAWTMLASSTFGMALKCLQLSNARLPILNWQEMGTAAAWGSLLATIFWLAFIPGSWKPADGAA